MIQILIIIRDNRLNRMPLIEGYPHEGHVTMVRDLDGNEGKKKKTVLRFQAPCD